MSSVHEAALLLAVVALLGPGAAGALENRGQRQEDIGTVPVRDSDQAGGETFSLRAMAVTTLAASAGGAFRLGSAAVRTVHSGPVFADGFESGDLTAWSPPLGMPTGTVAFFESGSCPPGWSPLEAAGGRALVGTPLGGSNGGTEGSPLVDLENRVHPHVVDRTVVSETHAGHSHWWVTVTNQLNWTSSDINGNWIILYQWTDGIGSEGSGLYPFTTEPGAVFGTELAGAHGHSAHFVMEAWAWNASLPYLQLLVCRKV